MSRHYSMSIAVAGLKKDEIETVKKAAEEEWNFEGWFAHNPDDPGNENAEASLTLIASGEGSLAGGEQEEEFAERLSKSMWQVLGRFVSIELNETYLEELPYETYTLGQEDYERIMATPNSDDD